MKIYCKSGLNNKELAARTNLVHDGCEIQLLNDFVKNPKSTEEYLDEIDGHITNIKLIHSPLCTDKNIQLDAINIEDLISSRVTKVFQRVCELADCIGKENKLSIGVILHTGISMFDLNTNKTLDNYLIDLFNKILNLYPNIYLLIENVIPVTNRDLMYFRNGALPNYIEVIEHFKKVTMYPNKIGGVLDTCHAITTIKMAQGCGKQLNLTDYFKRPELINLIHLSDVKNLGLYPKEHGIGFSPDREFMLKLLLDLYKSNDLNCPITIEIAEEDYFDCKNYRHNRELLNKLL